MCWVMAASFLLEASFGEGRDRGFQLDALEIRAGLRCL